MQIRAKDWWANREHGERGGVHVGQTLRVESCWRFVYWCILSLDDNCIGLIDIHFHTSWICFQTRGTPHLHSFAIVQGFHNILSINTHTNTFSTYRLESRISKVHVSRSCESGVLLLGIRTLADRFWRRHTCTTLRRTARLIGWSIMYCLLDYCLIVLFMMIELFSD